ILQAAHRKVDFSSFHVQAAEDRVQLLHGLFGGDFDPGTHAVAVAATGEKSDEQEKDGKSFHSMSPSKRGWFYSALMRIVWRRPLRWIASVTVSPNATSPIMETACCFERGGFPLMPVTTSP